MSPCSFPMRITITPRAPPEICLITINKHHSEMLEMLISAHEIAYKIEFEQSSGY